jgi:cob(I)alamin adenosyltransferase
MKGRDASELHALRHLSPTIEVHRCGLRRFIVGAPTEEDRVVARSGLDAAREALVAGNHDLVILDEANVAVDRGLFAVDDLLAVVDARPCAVELVVTGRKAHPRLIERADLVTEMREIKHYYHRGLPARAGIEE